MVIVFIASIALLQVLVIFVHLAVYQTAVAAFGIGGPWVEGIFIFLSISFTSASFLTVKYKSKALSWYYTASAYWFGLVHFLFIGTIFFLIVLDGAAFFNYSVSLPLLGTLCFVPFFLLHLYGTWASGRGDITRITIKLKQSVPDFWRSRTLVFVSDLHLGNVRGAAFARKVVNKISALSPAAVMIGGDLYDGPLCDEAEIVEPLRALKPEKGTYFITGNHEYFGSTQKFIEAIAGAGIRILDNETISVEGIDFIGLDYKATHKKEDLVELLKCFTIDKNKPTVLLMHEPIHREELAAAGFSLGFFGHTHRGQIYPLTYVTKSIYKGFDYGLKSLGAMQFYVSSGVGTWGPPLRLGTKSEIVAVTFA